MSSEPVLVVLTGGTVRAGYGVESLVDHQAVDAWMANDGQYDVVIEDLGNRPSPGFSLEDVAVLAARIDQLADYHRTRSVVVLAGTDALEEIAFSLDLLCDSSLRIACTGAMYSPDEEAFDGGDNLTGAVRLVSAAAERDESPKAVVVMGRRVYSARGATKVDSEGRHSYDDPWMTTPVTIRADGRAPSSSTLPRRAALPGRAGDGPPPTVPIVHSGVGETAEWLECVLHGGVHGLVIAAMGAGNTHAGLFDRLTPWIASGLPVALTSRCYRGSVEPRYRYDGGAYHWARAGAILCPRLSPVKARLLLALALWHEGRSVIERWLQDHATHVDESVGSHRTAR